MSKECPTPKGILVIIGGKENKGAKMVPNEVEAPEDPEPSGVLKTFVELTGKQKPVIEVITSASSEGDESFEEYRKVFEELKVENIGHIHHNSREEVMTDESMERIEKADVIFLLVVTS